ncbi:helix-turn-helix transcriptional regulator [Desulfovibrio sulfodismutans]|uniref:Helix-turn-helix transcriptional regulator n=1 Tax=Desulfolutivibrio sulfodismutans TaxID=63561 RepID=A0A7K3NI53_9BACT|nr:helix-turn-helix transcriptional regulator [Desulfolutivibrio sulfodismutans]NDY55876.1 helix-turn-helix transcriptional regulator [Desulfolutivibrio sulfodismutans]QLA11144.1 helix-turn-helix domain-containing protein [Desulfolutivibrio sulfodismutans DSM 3696]
MNEPINNPQIIRGPDGTPQYVVLPYDEYMESRERPDDEVSLPLEVVKLSLLEKWGLVRAWREHLGLTQGEVARRMGVTQPTYAGFEQPGRILRYSTRSRIARALGIEPEQLKDE